MFFLKVISVVMHFLIRVVTMAGWYCCLLN